WGGKSWANIAIACRFGSVRERDPGGLELQGLDRDLVGLRVVGRGAELDGQRLGDPPAHDRGAGLVAQVDLERAAVLALDPLVQVRAADRGAALERDGDVLVDEELGDPLALEEAEPVSVGQGLVLALQARDPGEAQRPAADVDPEVVGGQRVAGALLWQRLGHPLSSPRW